MIHTPHAGLLEARYLKLENFFRTNGKEQHPLLLEAFFGSVLGHLKLSAVEIPILLQQKEPSRFIERYLKVRPDLKPNPQGTAFELRACWKDRRWHLAATWLGLTLYFLFMATSLLLLGYALPSAIREENWSDIVSVVMLSIMFGTCAWIMLSAGTKVNLAVTLYESQIANDEGKQLNHE